MPASSDSAGVPTRSMEESVPLIPLGNSTPGPGTNTAATGSRPIIDFEELERRIGHLWQSLEKRPLLEFATRSVWFLMWASIAPPVMLFVLMDWIFDSRFRSPISSSTPTTSAESQQPSTAATSQPRNWLWTALWTALRVIVPLLAGSAIVWRLHAILPSAYWPILLLWRLIASIPLVPVAVSTSLETLQGCLNSNGTQSRNTPFGTPSFTCFQAYMILYAGFLLVQYAVVVFWWQEKHPLLYDLTQSCGLKIGADSTAGTGSASEGVIFSIARWVSGIKKSLYHSLGKTQDSEGGCEYHLKIDIKEMEEPGVTEDTQDSAISDKSSEKGDANDASPLPEGDQEVSTEKSSGSQDKLGRTLKDASESSFGPYEVVSSETHTDQGGTSHLRANAGEHGSTLAASEETVERYRALVEK